RNDAVKTARKAAATLDEKTLAALGKNVKPDTDADVKTATDALKKANDDLQPLEQDWSGPRNTREAAWDDVPKQQQAVDLAVQTAKAKKAEPDTDPDVVAARAALAVAQAALIAA